MVLDKTTHKVYDLNTNYEKLLLKGLDSTITVHQLIEAIGIAIDGRCSSSTKHSIVVADISYLIALEMKIDFEEANIIHIAGHLHDIGKLYIPDNILKKEGKLTIEEWNWMKYHPEIGADILRSVNSFNSKEGVCNLILHHHERYDGKGYPHGLKGKEIPIGARIIAVSDTLSALIEDRSYRSKISIEKAFEIIINNSGSQFDPKVVEVLKSNTNKIKNKIAQLI